MSNIRVVHLIDFKREEHSPMERGISIGPNPDESGVIIDKDYQLVTTPVWSFGKVTPYYEGCIKLNISK